MFEIVLCGQCENPWIVEEHDRRSQDSVSCPHCPNDVTTPKVVNRQETREAAAEARAQYLADQAGADDVYRRFRDEWGPWDSQLEAVEDRTAKVSDEVLVEFVTADEAIDNHYGAVDGRDAHLDPDTEDYRRRYAEVADAVAEQTRIQRREMFDDRVTDKPVDWDLCRDDVDEMLEEWGGAPDAADIRTGELALDNQLPAAAAADVTLDGGTTATDLWASLLEQGDVQQALYDGIRRFADGLQSHDLQERLEQAGVPHDLRSTVERLSRGIDRGDDTEQTVTKLLYGSDSEDGLFYVTRRHARQRNAFEKMLGVSRLVGWATPDDDIEPPTIVCRLDRTFESKGRDTRANVVALLEALARHCEVVIASGSPVDLRWSAVDHDLEPDSFSERWTGRRGSAGIDERVEAAVDTYDRDSTAVTILRALHDDVGGVLSYNELTSTLHTSKATISQWVSGRDDSLTTVGLVEMFEADGRQSQVELMPAGRKAIEAFDNEIARQRRLGDWFSEPLHPSDHGREVPRPHEGGQDDDPRRKGDGLASVGKMSRARAAGAVGSAVDGAFSTVDYPVDRADDYRCPELWTDSNGARVVASAEYVNPMQYWASMARALTHPRVWNNVLTDGRLESTDYDFGELFDEYRDVLRSSRCLGHLPDNIESVSDYRRELLDARDHLEDLLTELSNEEFEDESRLRGTITSDALGLVGTMVHIMDLCDVDVVREVRLPTFSKDFDANRWEDLVRTLSVGASIQSVYEHKAAYRQLFETRQEKLEWTIFAEVDAADPVGDMIGSFVLVGNFGYPNGGKHEQFLDDLEAALQSPKELRDDAPEFVVGIPVHAFEYDREQFAIAANRVGRQKNLRPTLETVSALTLFAATPYDVADAINWLEREGRPRDLRADEVRYSLSKLPSDRILRHESPGARAIVTTLLETTEPISTGDLSEWADVARSTLSRSDNSAPGDRLKALGLIEQTDEGWRLTLSFPTNEERFDEVILPTIAAKADTLQPWAIFEEAAYDLVEDPGRWGDPEDPVCGCWLQLTEHGLPDLERLAEHWEWVHWWIPVLEDVLDCGAGVSIGEGQVRTATMGPRIEQQPLPTADSSEVKA